MGKNSLVQSYGGVLKELCYVVITWGRMYYFEFSLL